MSDKQILLLERGMRNDAAPRTRGAAAGTIAQNGGACLSKCAVLPRGAGSQGGKTGADPVPGRPPRPALHDQRRPARTISAETPGDTEGRRGARARLLGHDRQADRQRLQRGRPGHVGRGDGARLHDGRLHPPRRRPQRPRLRPVHRRARVPPGRGKDRGDGHPVRRRHVEAPDPSDGGFRGDGPGRDPLLRGRAGRDGARDGRGFPCADEAARRPPGRRTLDRRDAPRAGVRG